MASEKQIIELAYSIWEKEGCSEGKDVEQYYRAKKMLEEQEVASSINKDPVPQTSTLQQPSVSKQVERHTGKRRLKKA